MERLQTGSAGFSESYEARGSIGCRVCVTVEAFFILVKMGSQGQGLINFTQRQTGDLPPYHRVTTSQVSP